MARCVIRTPELEDMFPFLPLEETEAVRKSAMAIGGEGVTVPG